MSHEYVGDAYMLFVVDAENPLVERPVMELAECDPVFHVVGGCAGNAMRPGVLGEFSGTAYITLDKKREETVLVGLRHGSIGACCYSGDAASYYATGNRRQRPGPNKASNE